MTSFDNDNKDFINVTFSIIIKIQLIRKISLTKQNENCDKKIIEFEVTSKKFLTWHYIIF